MQTYHALIPLLWTHFGAILVNGYGNKPSHVLQNSLSESCETRYTKKASKDQKEEICCNEHDRRFFAKEIHKEGCDKCLCGWTQETAVEKVSIFRASHGGHPLFFKTLSGNMLHFEEVPIKDPMADAMADAKDAAKKAAMTYAKNAALAVMPEAAAALAAFDQAKKVAAQASSIKHAVTTGDVNGVMNAGSEDATPDEPKKPKEVKVDKKTCETKCELVEPCDAIGLIADAEMELDEFVRIVHHCTDHLQPFQHLQKHEHLHKAEEALERDLQKYVKKAKAETEESPIFGSVKKKQGAEAYEVAKEINSDLTKKVETLSKELDPTYDEGLVHHMPSFNTAGDTGLLPKEEKKIVTMMMRGASEAEIIEAVKKSLQEQKNSFPEEYVEAEVKRIAADFVFQAAEHSMRHMVATHFPEKNIMKRLKEDAPEAVAESSDEEQLRKYMQDRRKERDHKAKGK